LALEKDISTPAEGDTLTWYSSSFDSGINETFSPMHDGHAGNRLLLLFLPKTVALQKHDSHSAKCLSEPVIAAVVVAVTTCIDTHAGYFAQCAHIPCRQSTHSSTRAYSLPVFYIG
jgi:hypothetical protein